MRLLGTLKVCLIFEQILSYLIHNVIEVIQEICMLG